MKAETLRTLAPTCLVLSRLLLGLWEWLTVNRLARPEFHGQPSWASSNSLWDNLTNARFWTDLGYTLLAVFASFVIGSVAAMITGLGLCDLAEVRGFLRPLPLGLQCAAPHCAGAAVHFVVWFGHGLQDRSGCVSLTFFIVLSSTVAGIRGVSQDHVTLTRTLGASSRQMFFSVTLPGAVPVIFSGLRLGVIYALLGVVGAEVIASERGLGQQLAYLGSTFNVNGVWSLLFDLAAHRGADHEADELDRTPFAALAMSQAKTHQGDTTMKFRHIQVDPDDAHHRRHDQRR
jgi:NitT/TauT family transport system permease protein